MTGALERQLREQERGDSFDAFVDETIRQALTPEVVQRIKVALGCPPPWAIVADTPAAADALYQARKAGMRALAAGIRPSKGGLE